MYIEDLEEVSVLRNHRLRAIELRDAAKEGSMGDLIIWHEGNKRDTWTVISAEPVRAAIMAECEKMIAEKDHALAQLGVNVARKLVERAA